ncbi:citrate/2-methylcitrate synthase [Roseibium porphyridii]|uniref:citrate synthase (unknown stereospecificity) n=1 Tax=Roseibium porphyridii TaxID=2866279 RepID=A0ABY8F3J7_9HYPH|nr:citrate/2-methylcitrate synthase [Roseibium sp. KMA01]WFE90070.1 citrate/2-methylcitrate synthase [Roseibium sp. KMA01]
MINIDKYNQYMSKPVYLSAREAATELGVQPATLYAYVSRGLISSVAGPGKQRRYDAGDVRRLKGRKSVEETAGSRPLTGDPVLETELTLISEDGPVYRGRLARDLARNSTLETVATLLWSSEEDPFAEAAPADLPNLPQGLGPLDRLMMALASWPLQDKAAFTQAPKLLKIKGAALLRFGVAALLDTKPSAQPIHTQIAECFGASSNAKNAIRSALVLSADHELNTSAFAARCAASTRAPLHAALLSGLGAFTGPRHGAASDRTSAWLSEIGPESDIEAALSDRLSRGEQLPGFGHSIYGDKDPRADCLLDLLCQNEPRHPFVDRLPSLIASARDLYGLSPNVDFSLAAIQKTYDLPRDAGKIIFCAARITGWIAHALEQYASHEQIRPRAAYVGERPE